MTWPRRDVCESRSSGARVESHRLPMPSATMGRSNRAGRALFVTVFILASAVWGLFASIGSCAAQSVDTLWTDGFEGDWSSRWADDHGTWEAGAPTSGPNATHSGTNLLATVLAGNYTEGVSSRFYQLQSWAVPAASQHPRLRFWHWWSIGGDDAAYVQIQVEGGAWQSLESYASHSCNHWTRGFVDLTAFAGQTVKIGFYFHSQTAWNGATSVGPGWYIDDIAVETGDRRQSWPEGWEDGMGGWYADRGMWEVGAPTSGPQGGHPGSNVAATILDGNYSENLDCRLISPPFVVPAADQFPRLRFWHWWSIGGDDAGYVQVRVRGGAWQTLEGYSSHSSNRWTRGFVDLAAYADSSVELALYFASRTAWNGATSVGPGWYIDDVTIETGQRPLDHVTTWDGPDGIGAWYADRGTWEVGVPTIGPDSAYSGTNVAATILDGNYFENLDSRLISPPFFLRPPIGNTPFLRLRNWYSLGGDDVGYVQLRVRQGAWQTLPNGSFTGSSGASGDWSSNPYFDLSAYTDSLVQMCFYLASRTAWNGATSVGPGWYIDDVRIEYTVAWTPTLITRFEARASDEGVRIEWQCDQPERLLSATLERAQDPIGPWLALSIATQRAGIVTTALDQSASTGQTNFYRLTAILADGTRATFGPISATALLAARVSGLTGIAPNPVSGSAKIDYTLAREERVRISVVDVSGREAAVLANGKMSPGSYSMIWDGRDGSARLPAGVYFVRWDSPGRTMNRRLVLVH